MKDKLAKILSKYTIDPMIPRRRRKRMQDVARLACQNFTGDLLEIGAHVGKTTVKLLEVAKKFNRRVLVVDPWMVGTQNCRGGERAVFNERTKPLREFLDVIALPSQHFEAVLEINKRDLAFALVDGLHTYTACQCDIKNARGAGIIVVDDILKIKSVRKAFFDAALSRGSGSIHRIDDGFREGYLIDLPPEPELEPVPETELAT